MLKEQEKKYIYKGKGNKKFNRVLRKLTCVGLDLFMKISAQLNL